jgi:hypothetical protein
MQCRADTATIPGLRKYRFVSSNFLKTIITISAFLTLTINLFGQSLKQLDKFLKSDSIVIVSHEATDGVMIVNDSTGKRVKPPQLLISDKLNDMIVKERKKLDSLNTGKLIKILKEPFEDKTIEEGNCFIPHHAILFYKKGKLSYIDICFGCRGFITSKDLEFIDGFDKKKWRQMEAFLKSLGITYEMPLD